MNSLKKIEKELTGHKNVLKKRFHIKKIGFFGSYARGEQNKKSDIDILVEFNRAIGLFEFMDIEEYLQNLLGKKVDLVSKKALKPRIGKRILEEVVYL